MSGATGLGFYTTAGETITSITVTTNDTAVAIAEFAIATAPVSVTYNGNGNTSGTVPTDATAYISGATVTVAANSGSLARTGYTFGGWNIAADGSGANYTAGSGTFTINANTTLYAKWTINNYTVSFNSNGGTSVTSQTVAYNGTATSPTAPTKSGSTFAGWYSDVGLTSAFVFSTPITADTTLYAKWTLIPTATSIPTLSEWGMIVLSGLMAFCGFFILRRRGQLRF